MKVKMFVGNANYVQKTINEWFGKNNVELVKITQSGEKETVSIAIFYKIIE